MNVKFYTQSDTAISNPFNHVLKNGEYLLLGIVALVGLLGSMYILTDSSTTFPKNELSQFSTAAIAEQKKSDFDKYVKITGDKKVGSELSFDIDMDLKAKRYVMEMGDGRRMILTQPNFTYKYAEKGEYVLELKELQRGLIVLVGDKKIKIK